MANIKVLSDLIAMLEKALSEPSERVTAIMALQRDVFERATPVQGANPEQWRILCDLAFDLDYYESDVKSRQEDAAFYGNQRVETEIRDALEKVERARHQ